MLWQKLVFPDANVIAVGNPWATSPANDGPESIAKDCSLPKFCIIK